VSADILNARGGTRVAYHNDICRRLHEPHVRDTEQEKRGEVNNEVCDIVTKI
jgi:hypothetical protein